MAGFLDQEYKHELWLQMVGIAAELAKVGKMVDALRGRASKATMPSGATNKTRKKASKKQKAGIEDIGVAITDAQAQVNKLEQRMTRKKLMAATIDALAKGPEGALVEQYADTTKEGVAQQDGCQVYDSSPKAPEEDVEPTDEVDADEDAVSDTNTKESDA